MNMKDSKAWISSHNWIIPVLTGLVLRLYKITFSSIWHDEGYTMWLINNNFSDIVARTARDVHPPAYYFISKLWILIAGNSVFSIRFLSLLFSIGIIYFAYKIVELVWSKEAAFWTGMLVAFSPFMVRFGQEARMYGVVAFFTTLATYFFVKYIKDNNWKYLLGYIPAMIIAMYTQYYAFFVLVSHWVILSVFTPGFWSFKWKSAWKKTGILDPKWWAATISLLLLYLPWFGVAYRQVTRVSGSYWIKPEWINERTIPNNILQFVTYTHFDKVYFSSTFGPVIYWVVAGFLVLISVYLLKYHKKTGLSLIIYGYLPMILVFILSKLRTPVYQDRYFPFSGVALFAIWGILISLIKNKKVQILVGSAVLSVLFVGNYIMHVDVNHQMKQVTEILEMQKQPGDTVTSGELYTFLDSSYYLGYGNVKFISNGVDGYGESSLFYDQQDKYLIKTADAQKSDRVWVIGKTGDKDYYKTENWPGWDQVTYFREEKDNGLKLMLFIKR